MTSRSVRWSWGGPVSGYPTDVIGGICIAQSCAKVSFTVNQNNTVTCFIGGGFGLGGCTPDLPISEGRGDAIQGTQFQISTVNPPIYGATGVFDSSTRAHGTITVPVGPKWRDAGSAKLIAIYRGEM